MMMPNPLGLLALTRRGHPPRVVSRRPSLDEAPDMTGKTFLFICGLHRSGTSILHRMLRDHPEASGFENTGVPEDEGQFLQTVLPTGEALGGPGRFAYHPRAHLTEEAPLPVPDARSRLLREWGAYLDVGKRIFLEKSPPNLVRTRLIQKIIPESTFIFIVRHPIPVCLATEKWINRSRLNLLTHWCYAHRLMLQDLPHIRHRLLIRYEDLVQDPEQTVSSIYKMLEIDQLPLKQKLADHNPRYFDSWQKHNSESYRNSIRFGVMAASVLADFRSTLGQLGYRLHPPFVTDPAPLQPEPAR